MISCPVTSLYFIISSIALCGFPFLSGFFSRDIIIEFFFQGKINLIMGCLIVLSTLFTLTYSVRLLYFSFFNNMGSRYLLILAERINILIPITFLIFMSVLAGGWLRVYLFPMNFIFLPLWLKLLVVTIIFSFFFIYFFLVDFKVIKKISSTSGLDYFLGSMWLLPFISTFALTPIIKYGVKILNLADQGWVEFLGGQGFIDKSKFISSKADVLNSVRMKFFIFSFFMGVLVLFLA